MNRRDFLFGGAVLGIVTGAAKAVAEESKPEGSFSTCGDGVHTPVAAYAGPIPSFAIGSGHEKGGMRALVPCAKCGVLFARQATYQPNKNPTDPGIRFSLGSSSCIR